MIKNLKLPWTIEEANFAKNSGSVFSCFACGGGSSFGYKLAGFDVIGCNEIDPKIFAIYKKNHSPKYPFVCSIRDMLNKELPKELYNLDILDGSPPCSSFSLGGNRDKDWGKEKKFSEGQSFQRLDDLFFSFIELAKKLQPKYIVAENVKGLISGKAKGYTKEIIKAFELAGYRVQIFLLNACKMGVPQIRERVFFICSRKDLDLDKIKLYFNEKVISSKQAFLLLKNNNIKKSLFLKGQTKSLYHQTKPGDSFAKAHFKGSYFSYKKLSSLKPSLTLTATPTQHHFLEPRKLTVEECQIIGSFPSDYDFLDINDDKKKWLIGMSVPPFMVAKIAQEIKKQWVETTGEGHG